MGTVDLLLVVLLAVASILCGVAIWALLDVMKTARSVRELSDDTRERLVPLLDKADVTVDAVNAELLRVDAIITQVEETSDRVEPCLGDDLDIVNAPAEIVNDVAVRIRRAWKDKQVASKAAAIEQVESVPDEPPDEECRLWTRQALTRYPCILTCEN